MSENNSGGSRHISRFIAVQSLYAKQFNKNKKISDGISASLEEIINDESETNQVAKNPDTDFLKKILSGTEQNLTAIDEVIKSAIDKKKFGENLNKFDILVLSILRAGAYELAYLGDIPVEVIIDEYVSITSSLCFDKEVGFVNGVLDKIARGVRDEGN